MTLKVFLLVIVLIAISVMAIAIKMFFKKGAEFKKSCSSKDGAGCVCDGNKEKCENKLKH